MSFNDAFTHKLAWSFGGFGVGVWRTRWIFNGYHVALWSIAIGPVTVYIRETPWAVEDVDE